MVSAIKNRLINKLEDREDVKDFEDYLENPPEKFYSSDEMESLLNGQSPVPAEHRATGVGSGLTPGPSEYQP